MAKKKKIIEKKEEYKPLGQKQIDVLNEILNELKKINKELFSLGGKIKHA